MQTTIFVLIALWTTCAGFAAFIAKSKRRDAVGWFLLGLMFGILALIAIAAVPALAEPQSTSEQQRHSAQDELKAERSKSRRETIISSVFMALWVIGFMILYLAYR